ncbi:MAG: hypothetical protein JO202_16670, partial [Ktedonobacteraceae bacterium]|nr:hypothetical protein [Ktedonobacteraceae bacterium]
MPHLVDPQGHLYCVSTLDNGRFQPELLVSLPTGGCAVVALCSSHTGQPLSFVQRRHAVRFTVLHARRAHRLAARWHALRYYPLDDTFGYSVRLHCWLLDGRVVSDEQAEVLFQRKMQQQPRSCRVSAVNVSQGCTPVGV